MPYHFTLTKWYNVSMSKFAKQLREDIDKCQPPLSQDELGKAVGLSRGRISHFLSRAQVPRDIPSAEILTAMAAVIGSRQLPQVDPEKLAATWRHTIAIDKLLHYCPELTHPNTTSGVHVDEMYNIVQYARLMLQGVDHATDSRARDLNMRYVPLSELQNAVVDVSTAIVTENPETSVVPTATHLVALPVEPNKGDWCMYVTKDGGARTDVYAPEFRPAGTVFTVLQFFRV